MSTINTNVYSLDTDTADVNLHGEFADDNIKVETDGCELRALERLQPRIDQFLSWCKDHNIGYTMEKIQVMVFRPPTAPRPYRCLAIRIDGNLKYEIDVYKVLGTYLSSDLNFDHHFSMVTKSAYAAFHQARSFVINNNQPVQDSMITLYKGLIRQRLDFSIAAIVNISAQSFELLGTVQRTCLLAATKCIAQTSTEELNVLTNITPIETSI